MMIDLIIPLKFEHLNQLKLGIDYIYKNIVFDNLIIITANGKINTSFKYQNIKFIDENSIMEGLSFENIKKIIQQKDPSALFNTGHYFQMFLKFAYCRICKNKAYQFLDADTIPLKPFIMEDHGKYYFDMKTEYNEPYFITQQTLLGLPKTDKRSFIAEHMIIDTMVMRDLLDRIEANADIAGISFFEKILNAIKIDKNFYNAFAEPETYGAFVDTFYPDLYIKRNYDSFRFAKCVWNDFIDADLLDWIARTTNYPAISIELWGKPSKFAALYSSKIIRKLFKADHIMRIWEMSEKIRNRMKNVNFYIKGK